MRWYRGRQRHSRDSSDSDPAVTVPGDLTEPRPSVLPTNVPPARPHPEPLVQYVLPLPADARPITRTPDGPFTVSDEAAWSDNEQERTDLLRRVQFQRGFVRRWFHADTAVEIKLYQFASADLAGDFYLKDMPEHTIDGWGPAKDVSIVPGAKQFATGVADQNGYISSLAIALSVTSSSR